MATLDDFDFSQLAAPQRLLLAQQLLDSVLHESMPLSSVELVEIDRRLDEIESGAVVCESWSAVRAELLRGLK